MACFFKSWSDICRRHNRLQFCHGLTKLALCASGMSRKWFTVVQQKLGSGMMAIGRRECPCNDVSLSSFLSKLSTRKLTAPHLLTGAKVIRSKIVKMSPCSFRTPRRGSVGLKLAEWRLTLLWPGFRFSLDLQLCCITFRCSSSFSKLNLYIERFSIDCRC